MRIGLTAATGFVIAFAWREPLIVFVNDFVLKYVKNTAEFQAGIISAFIITILGVFFIWILSRYSK